MKKIALAGLATAALVFAPSAAADVPGIAPFVGQWHAHQSGLTINADGSGHLTYSDINACSGPCSFADAPTGTADFTLTSVSGGTATGSVTATSDTNNDTVGGPVTIKVVTGIGYPYTGPPASVSGNNGVVLAVSMGKMRDWNYCNDTTHNYCGS
jgi:hypothetical protein